jgi:hypothetical protein
MITESWRTMGRTMAAGRADVDSDPNSAAAYDANLNFQERADVDSDPNSAAAYDANFQELELERTSSYLSTVTVTSSLLNESWSIGAFGPGLV